MGRRGLRHPRTISASRRVGVAGHQRRRNPARIPLKSSKGGRCGSGSNLGPSACATVKDSLSPGPTGHRRRSPCHVAGDRPTWRWRGAFEGGVMLPAWRRAEGHPRSSSVQSVLRAADHRAATCSSQGPDRGPAETSGSRIWPSSAAAVVLLQCRTPGSPPVSERRACGLHTWPEAYTPSAPPIVGQEGGNCRWGGPPPTQDTTASGSALATITWAGVRSRSPTGSADHGG